MLGTNVTLTLAYDLDTLAHMATAQLAPSMLQFPVQTITPPSTEGTPIHSLCQGRATAGITNKKGKSPETAGSLPHSNTKTSESRHHGIQPAQRYSLCSEPLKGKRTMIGEWIRHSSLQLSPPTRRVRGRDNTAAPYPDPQLHLFWFCTINYGSKILNEKFQT